ncbi:MAG TPA: 50S ribosomal protein L20 [Verrucomicrobiae bacterium]|nr:50S ribosomal protein L20 [Verrucomicrobiae bacterium]
MPRVKRGINTHKRHANLLERAKGFRNGRRTLVKRATEALLKAGQFAYRDRRTKKRDMRRGWIVRINAAVRPHGISYSQFMNKLKEQNIDINRKVLSEMALTDEKGLESLVKQVVSAK